MWSPKAWQQVLMKIWVRLQCWIKVPLDARLSWDVNNPERMSQAIGNIPHTLLSLGRILRPLTTFYVMPMVSYEVLEDSHVPDRENRGEWPYRAVLQQYFFRESCSEWPNKLSWMSGDPIRNLQHRDRSWPPLLDGQNGTSEPSYANKSCF